MSAHRSIGQAAWRRIIFEGVVSIDDGKILFDTGEMVLTGAALHLDQGIAVTSHASQAKTVDQVIASVPVRAFSQANQAQFYVSM